jgi:hypothetical protein
MVLFLIHALFLVPGNDDSEQLLVRGRHLTVRG